MKRFQILTEADARVLDHGSSVVLVRGGQVTPLAADTLRERRVTVIRESGDGDSAALAPVSNIRTVAIGSDHNGVALRLSLRQYLRSTGLAVHDLGTDSDKAVDYPEIAAAVARQVARGEADAGIVIDGSGMGSAIAANKIHGIRAAMCLSPTLARYARQHNGANVLSLGASFVTEADARDVLDMFIRTAMREPRYLRRLLKIRDLETDG